MAMSTERALQLPEQAQHMVMQLQQYQQQLQLLVMQRQQMELQLAEINAAVEALKTVSGDEVFRAVGPILVRSRKAEVEKILADAKEVLELRIKTVQKQEGKVKEKVKEFTEKITPYLRGSGGDVSVSVSG